VFPIRRVDSRCFIDPVEAEQDPNTVLVYLRLPQTLQTRSRCLIGRVIDASPRGYQLAKPWTVQPIREFGSSNIPFHPRQVPTPALSADGSLATTTCQSLPTSLFNDDCAVDPASALAQVTKDVATSASAFDHRILQANVTENPDRPNKFSEPLPRDPSPGSDIETTQLHIQAANVMDSLHLLLAKAILVPPPVMTIPDADTLIQKVETTQASVNETATTQPQGSAEQSQTITNTENSVQQIATQQTLFSGIAPHQSAKTWDDQQATPSTEQLSASGVSSPQQIVVPQTVASVQQIPWWQDPPVQVAPRQTEPVVETPTWRSCSYVSEPTKSVSTYDPFSTTNSTFSTGLSSPAFSVGNSSLDYSKRYAAEQAAEQEQIRIMASAWQTQQVQARQIAEAQQQAIQFRQC